VKENKKESKKNKLEFHTYCIFTEEKQNIEETIGFIFRDYIEKWRSNTK